MFTSSGEVTVTTIAGGLVGETGKLPLSGYAPAAIALPRNAAQIIPTGVTFTGIDVHATTTAALSLVGSTIAIQVSLVELGSSEQTTSLGTCTLSPALTGALAIGTEMSAKCTLSAAVEAGARAYLQVEATASGLSLLNTVGVDVDAGLTMS